MSAIAAGSAAAARLMSVDGAVHGRRAAYAPGPAPIPRPGPRRPARSGSPPASRPARGPARCSRPRRTAAALGRVDVARDGGQRGVGELRVQCRQRLPGRARRAPSAPPAARVSASRRSGALMTRSRSFPNASRCASSSSSAPRRRHDHPGQQVAALRGRLGNRVVEDLAHVERLGRVPSSRPPPPG